MKVEPYVTGIVSKGDPKKPRDRMSHLPSLGRHAVRNTRETQSWPVPRIVSAVCRAETETTVTRD